MMIVVCKLRIVNFLLIVVEDLRNRPNLREIKLWMKIQNDKL